jgi:hypothetical protein
MPSRHPNKLDGKTGLYRIGKPTKNEKALGFLNAAMEGLRYATMYLEADNPELLTIEDIAECIREVHNRIQTNADQQRESDE